MIIESCVGHTFLSFNYDLIMFFHTWHGRCQYLILVYIIYTCKERQNLHVRCENSGGYEPKFARPMCRFGLLMLLVCSYISRFAYAMCKLYKKSLLVITFGHFHLECILLFLLICNLIFCIGHLALWCSLAYLCVIYQSLHWIYGVYWLACKSFQQSFSVFSRTDYN